jgi:SAM-dependent methyltransferase
MDAEHIEVQPESFDAAISRLGLIYFPDQQAALTCMRNALRKGGRAAAIVFSTPDRNRFFSVPVSIIQRRANLPPPRPGQPGPFNLGAAGVLLHAYEQAGFRDVDVRVVEAPLHLASAAECLRFERESFGALHQMLSGLDLSAREAAWDEIEKELSQFEGPNGFTGPCELVVAAGTK